ncbi:hypothetical protein CMI37_36540 [Candidatus Pacearchaeota archaeon]|nr:hypothetical protein [Candidatus Pacearchaeota archaeon]
MSNTIQSLWIGKKLSQVERLCISSYINNGHEFHLYSYNEIEGLPGGCELKNANDILPESDVFAYNKGIGKGSFSAFSNYFRYKMLELVGGWWTDTDIVCLKKIDLKDDFVFASEKTSDGDSHITSGIIKSPAGSEFSKFCYNFCRQQDKETLEWGTVGPRLVKKAVLDLGLANYVKPWEWFNPIGFEQFGMLFDETFGTIDLTNSYTLHLWNEMWRRAGVSKNQKFHEDCLLEKLKIKYEIK